MKTLVLAVLSILAVGCAQQGPGGSAPIAPVGQTNPNGNLISLGARGLTPSTMSGPATTRMDRDVRTETIEVLVRPDVPASKKPLAWYLLGEETQLVGREIRTDGAIVYRFLRPAGMKTPGDELDGVRIFPTAR